MIIRTNHIPYEKVMGMLHSVIIKGDLLHNVVHRLITTEISGLHHTTIFIGVKMNATSGTKPTISGMAVAG